MKNLFLVLKTDVNEALRSKWFLVYTLIFGGIIALVGCYTGIHAAPGAEGVGRATTESVVVSIMLIFICNYFLTVLLF